MDTGHPLLLNDLNLQRNLQSQGIAICNEDEQLVGHVPRYISTLSMMSLFKS